MAGITVCILLGPGKDAPKITPITAVVGLLLLVFEYLYVREVMKRKGIAITIGWTVAAIIVLGILLIPEIALITLVSFLWAITLPILVIYILVLSYILLVRITSKTP